MLLLMLMKRWQGQGGLIWHAAPQNLVLRDLHGITHSVLQDSTPSMPSTACTASPPWVHSHALILLPVPHATGMVCPAQHAQQPHTQVNSHALLPLLVLLAARLQPARQPKVAELYVGLGRAAAGQQNILHLEVPVQHLGGQALKDGEAGGQNNLHLEIPVEHMKGHH